VAGDPARAIEQATGRRPARIAPLGGGCVGEVYRVDMADGETLVAKLGAAGGGLAVEGWMLRYLAGHSALPVPAVIHADDTLVLMSWIDSGDAITAPAETHAAELLAALHDVTAPAYGLERDTVIGGLAQPNARADSWIAFFRDRRLLYMAGEALAAGRLPAAVMTRIEAFAERLDKWIAEPACASLIHGDMWGGNVLVKGGRIAGFVDPAIYYADAEIELAFSTMFATFTAPFFARYGEIRPIRPGFREARCDIYNLYPLLVHTRLFGGGYAHSVDRTLARFGF
jgi:fructosamine-3-kinase